MRSAINSFIKTCDICQRIKGLFPRLGHLPVKQAEVNPWDEVQIDLVGPWTFQIPPKWSVSVLALTCIDPFSGLCDACRLEIKLSLHVSNILFPMVVAISTPSPMHPRQRHRIHCASVSTFTAALRNLKRNNNRQNPPSKLCY